MSSSTVTGAPETSDAPLNSIALWASYRDAQGDRKGVFFNIGGEPHAFKADSITADVELPEPLVVTVSAALGSLSSFNPADPDDFTSVPRHSISTTGELKCELKRTVHGRGGPLSEGIDTDTDPSQNPWGRKPAPKMSVPQGSVPGKMVYTVSLSSVPPRPDTMPLPSDWADRLARIGLTQDEFEKRRPRPSNQPDTVSVKVYAGSSSKQQFGGDNATEGSLGQDAEDMLRLLEGCYERDWGKDESFKSDGFHQGLFPRRDTDTGETVWSMRPTDERTTVLAPGWQIVMDQEGNKTEVPAMLEMVVSSRMVEQPVHSAGLSAVAVSEGLPLA